ncbi:hypothetical protein [Leptospira kirschneri]|uniref:hypothetical protein n=1 Tax=Leptospira kirschneri TaxID=29507 RepID=UPI00351D1994
MAFNFNFKGDGQSYTDQKNNDVHKRYQEYLNETLKDVQNQVDRNKADADAKKLVFDLGSAMMGGSSMKQAVDGVIQGKVTGAVAQATGLPASFVGALVGGGSMKDAVKAYQKSVTTEAISKATGIPEWYINGKIAEKEATHAMAKSFSYNMGRSLAATVTEPLKLMAKAAEAALDYTPYGRMIQAVAPNLKSQVQKLGTNISKQADKFADHIGKEAYKNKDTIDTVITVAAAAAAPFTGGGSLVALAAYKTVQGAVEGGVLGALAGAATIGNAPLTMLTGGMVSYDLSYSYDKGFGASIGGGMKLIQGLGVGASLSYNEQTGFGASVGLQAGTSKLSVNAGLSYSQAGGVSANAGIGLGMGKNASTGSYASTLNLGVSYNRQDGMGTSIGISRNNNVVLPGVGATVSRSEFGGWGAEVTTDQYGAYEGNGSKYNGVSGGLSWNEKTGVTVSLNSGGTNALNYNSSTGLTGNSDFLAQSAMNNALAQGVEQTDEEKAHAASKAAQERNNQRQGADAVAADRDVLQNIKSRKNNRPSVSA